ncbi:MAG: hydrogenase maturation protease [Syntrophorhabdaceae bacterium]|nr:hydrogenase maturation protease [Syntrophorhabdaceae bacterium]
MKILVIGYGNPGRSDDGLGPALAERLEALAIPGVTVEADYQLSIEHAAMVAEYDVVVFADADSSCPEPFYLKPVVAKHIVEFTSHSVPPEEILHIAHSCFNASPQGYVLGMRAQVLEPFSEGLSPAAQEVLEAALERLLGFVSERLSVPEPADG